MWPMRDRLTLLVCEIQEEDGTRRRVVDILINGRYLQEIIADIERPLAQKEDGGEIITGAYQGLSPEESRNFLTSGEDVVIMGCGCGVSACWPLTVTITLEGDTVTWSNFAQPHRGPDSHNPWSYGTLKFVFDRAEYERAFEPGPTDLPSAGS